MNLDDRLKKMEAALESKQADLEQRLRARLDGIRGEKPGTDASLAAPPQAAQPPARAGMAPHGLVNPAEMTALYAPRASEIEQAMAFVRHAPKVIENSQYRARAESTHFYNFESGDMVNAFATDEAFDLPGAGTLEPPAIVFFGGLARALCLTATALSVQRLVQNNAPQLQSQDFVRAAISRIGKTVVQSKGSLSAENAEEIFSELFLGPVAQNQIAAMFTGQTDDTYIELAQTLRSSMYMFVVGHELGHIAYGHTLGPTTNFEVSRRKEYDADSFALQVLTDSPFSKYTFLGQVFVTLIFAWMGHAAGEKIASSHPLARDRFQELFKDGDSRAAKQLAEEFGLTREKLEALLPG